MSPLQEIKARLSEGPMRLGSGQPIEGAPNITPADAEWLVGEVERLRTVVEGAALTMQELGQPTIRDNLLGAIGDLKSRL